MKPILIGILSSTIFLSSAAGLQAQEAAKTFTNEIGMEFVLIPSGEFMMGTPQPPASPDDPVTPRDESQDWMDAINLDELPLHKVLIPKPFFLGKYEVTQGEWGKVMHENPSYFNEARLNGDTSRHPVDSVSWLDVQEFIRRLNENDNASAYRLPTEAEWEYACRAGERVDYDLNQIGPYAWFDRNSSHKTKAVGTRQPNAWGLYDMYGNVWEWCQDWYERNYYAQSPETDPLGPSYGLRRVMRGGGIYDSAELCRAGYRGSGIPDDHSNSMGFRLVRIEKTN